MSHSVSKKVITYVDLFCGLGAFHTCFDKINMPNTEFHCVYACDIDDGVRNIYEENYGIRPDGDITLVDEKTMPDFDILCGGFPCQPFSIAGKKQAFDDKEKGNLFFQILRLIDSKHPKIVILENVKNLQTVHKGITFQIICNELEKRGYTLSFKVLDSKDYASPQSRQRIYMVGLISGLPEFKFPEPKNVIVPVSTIIDYSNKKWFEYQHKYELVPTKQKSGTMKYKLINKNSGLGGRQGERVYGTDSFGATICASSGGPGAKTGLYEIYPQKIRTLDINETLQMFGFPINYKYSSLGPKQKKMLFYLGNSIVVNVLFEIIMSLEDVFKTL